MRTSALLATGLMLLTLTGCVPVDPPVVPQPEPSSTPLFASEEEALAAAEEAYAAYLAASDAVLAGGGVDPQGTAPYLTETMQEQQVEGLTTFTDSGWHTTGSSKYDNFEAQQYFDFGDEGAELVAYVCVDVTELRIIDVSGLDVTPADRPNRLPLELAFVAEQSSTMRIERSDLWTGEDFCA